MINADFPDDFREPEEVQDGPNCPACGSGYSSPVHHDPTGAFLGYECGDCAHEAETLPPVDDTLSPLTLTGALHDD